MNKNMANLFFELGFTNKDEKKFAFISEHYRKKTGKKQTKVSVIKHILEDMFENIYKESLENKKTA